MALTWTLKQWLRTHHGLTNAKDIRDMIQHQTRHKIPLQTVQSLLKKQPKTLDTKILQAICDVFRCHLMHFCAVKPSPRPPLKRINVNIQHLLTCAIAPNETLRSFITRVQMAAIGEALLLRNNNFSHACLLLGSERGSLMAFYRRQLMKTTPNQNQPKKELPSRFAKAIPLPAAIFTIRKNEDFETFKGRIQLAAIIQTIKLEGNHTRAALRLGYNRVSLHRIRHRLTNSGSFQNS